MLIEVAQAQDDGTTLEAYINTDHVVAIAASNDPGVANVFLTNGNAMRVAIPEGGLSSVARQLGWSP